MSSPENTFDKSVGFEKLDRSEVEGLEKLLGGENSVVLESKYGRVWIHHTEVGFGEKAIEVVVSKPRSLGRVTFIVSPNNANASIRREGLKKKLDFNLGQVLSDLVTSQTDGAP